MPRLEVDFNDIPDEILPIDEGEYQLAIVGVPEIKPTKSGNASNLVVEFQVINNDKFNGRKLRDFLYLKDFGLTKVKQLLLSCGLTPGSGLDTEELTGCELRAYVDKRTYVVDGQTREAAQIKTYLFEKKKD